MKVLVIGGRARSLVNFRGELLKAMVKRGHKVVACAPNISTNIVERLTSFGVKPREVHIDRTGLNPASDLRTLLDLIKIFKEERPDKVLSYTIKPVLYGSFAARITGIGEMYSMITGLGYVFAETKGAKHKLISHLVSLLYKHAMKANRCIFFQNPDDMTLFRNRGLVPSHTEVKIINGSGVDLDHFAVAPLPEGPSFLLIARLIAIKGVREYVNAAQIVRSKFPEAKFFLAGWLDKNPSAITESELKSWQENGIIQYLGVLEDVRPAIARSSVYVLPSHGGEGTPRTVLEAMSMGRPIITTNTPGCKETVIPSVNGFLVPPKDSGKLAMAMETFVRQPELAAKMGKASRKIAEEKYDVHKVNKVILETMNL